MSNRGAQTLTAHALRQALGERAHYYAQIDSTNDHLQTLAAAGAPTGTLILADYQQTGKGRLGRRWETPPATSLLFSLLFYPAWPAEQAGWLTMIAGLAAVETLATVPHVPPLALKWPNDIMLFTGGHWAKVGGILLETTLKEGRLAQAILGMGLNVNIPAAALPEAATPATSLLVATGRPVARLPLLKQLVTSLERHYQAAGRGESPQPAWAARLLTRDRPVTVRSPSGTITGVARGTDAWGRLLVETASGRLQPVAAGDVTLRADE